MKIMAVLLGIYLHKLSCLLTRVTFAVPYDDASYSVQVGLGAAGYAITNSSTNLRASVI